MNLEKVFYQNLSLEYKEEKKRNSKTHLFNSPPNPEEIQILHERFLEFSNIESGEHKVGIHVKNYVTPRETRIENNVWMVFLFF